MKNKYVTKQIGFTFLFLCIALIGISYARWTNSNSMLSSITTGSLNYNFSDEGSKLTILHKDGTSQVIASNITFDNKLLNIDIFDAGAFTGMIDGDILVINYSLQTASSKKIALKDINNQYLGSVNILRDPNSVMVNSIDSGLSVDEVQGFLPDNLGSFDAYNSLHGESGEIYLIPVSLPATPVSGAAIQVDYESIADSSVTEDLLAEQTSKSQKQSEEGPEEDSEPICSIISISAKYNFSLSLDFDQYNAN